MKKGPVRCEFETLSKPWAAWHG